MANLEFRIIKKIRCVHAIGAGDINFRFMIDQIKEIHNHPDFFPPMIFFSDVKNAVLTFYDEDYESFGSFFKELQKLKIYKKGAIFTENEMTHQTANMHHLLVSGEFKVEVFKNREMALRFLGITEEDLTDY